VVRLEAERYHGKLNTLRTAPNEAQGVVYPIVWQLGQLLNQVHRVFSHDDLDDKLFGFVSEVRDTEEIGSLAELNRLFDKIEAEFEAGASDWRGHHKFTIRKARNRFNGMPTKFGGLLTDGLVDYGKLPRVEEPFNDGELRVVDIANCNTNVQELLVSQTINEIWHLAEQQKLGVDKVIIFVDELNKYAATGSESGLRDTLVDIAARGRHLNVVLFGAQQFRSKVDGEILGNCGTSFYGRIGDEEIINPSYRSISEAQKQELLGLPKGRLLVRHAHFRAPLFGVFPRPPAIAGMSGQRVFNDATGLAPEAHPSDGLFRTMQNLMGNGHPKKSEVRAATEGIDAEVLIRISGQVEQRWASLRGTSGASRFTPWNMALSHISEFRKSRG
jgi:DNA helicase HerA-like ATPase